MASGALALLAAAAVACSRGSPPDPPAEDLACPAGLTVTRRPNFIVFDIDSLRADRLGFRRGGESLTPHLDDLAARGVHFTAMRSQAGWTLPALSSLLTGRLPLVMTLEPRGIPWLEPDAHALPEILRLYGYRSTAIWGRFGSTGQDEWSAVFDQAASPFAQGDGFQDLAVEPVRFLAEGPEEPFFLFVHELDLHNVPAEVPAGLLRGWVPPIAPVPRVGPGRVFGRFADSFGTLAGAEAAVGHYDDLLTYYDDVVARVLAALEAAGLADRTVVIVTSNHGEELFERGAVLHGDQYEIDLRVPLVVVDPEAPVRGLVVDREVQSVDLAPTLLARACIPADEGMVGRSLLAALGWPAEDTSTPRTFVSITARFQASIQRGPHKLIERDPVVARNPGARTGWDARREGRVRRELYDLAADPRELYDLSAAQPELAAELAAELEAIVEDRRVAGEGARRIAVDADEAAALREQGYWGLVGSPGGPPPGP